MINVLVTSVGSGVGQSVLDSISHLKNYYRVIGIDLSERVFARNQCDDFMLSPRINEPNYINFLLEVCKNKSVKVLIPGNDGELELLSRNLPLFSEINVSVIVSPTKIVASSRNKFNWYQDYSDIINIVPTALYDSFIESPESHEEIAFPVIAKPAAGSASSGIKLFLSLEELLEDRLPSGESSNYVVQPYLMPMKADPDYAVLDKAVKERRLLQLSEISCQIVYDQNSEIVGTFVSKNSLKNGVPVTIEPITDNSILSVVNDIGEKLKAEKVVGPVNIQGRLTENGLVFFEMNLRFTGITGNRSLFGFNEVSCVIDSFAHPDIPPKMLSYNTSRVGARQVACSSSYPLSKKQVNTILLTGASSWAAKNLVNYLFHNEFLSEKKLILSSRDPLGLREAIYKQTGLNSEVANIEFIGVSDVELTMAIGLSDVVINYASARPPHGTKRIFDSTAFNLSLVDLIKKGNVGLVINMSSQSVYDTSSNSCCSEDASLCTDTAYSMSKLLVENLFDSVRTFTRGTDVVNLRLGRLWGGNLEMDENQFPFRLLDTALGDGNFTISNPSNQMSMLDIDDLSDSLVKLMSHWESQVQLPKALNLGGINTSLESLVSSMENVIKQEELPFTEVPVLNNDTAPNTFAVSSKLAEKLQVTFPSDLDITWRKLVRMYLASKALSQSSKH